MNSNLSLTLIISICVLITGGIAFADEIKSIKPLWKLAIFVTVSGIAIWLTIRKEQIGEKEKAQDKKEFRIERQRADSANDARLRAFEESVVDQLQNLNVKVTNIAPITSISFRKSNEGLIVSYHLTKMLTSLV